MGQREAGQREVLGQVVVEWEAGLDPADMLEPGPSSFVAHSSFWLLMSK